MLPHARECRQIAGGLVLLIAVWVGIYWLWPSEPKISFAQGDETIRGSPVQPHGGRAPGPSA